jgi:hypothetical protein
MRVRYHGYRKTGHRVVAFPANARGLLPSEPVELISSWDA